MTLSLLALIAILCVLGVVVVGAGVIIYAVLNDRKPDRPDR